MKVKLDFKVTTFEEAKHGALLVGEVRPGTSALGIKAFWADSPEEKKDYFIAIGPLPKEGWNVPLAYQPAFSPGAKLLDVTDTHYLRPHLDPQYLIPNPPQPSDCVGAFLITDECYYLGTGLHGRGVFGAAINLQSGEAVTWPKSSGIIATVRWDIMFSNDSGDDYPVLEYEARPITP